MTSKSRKVVVVGAWAATAVLGAGALTGVAMAAGSASGASSGPSASTAVASTGGTGGTGGTARAGRLRAMSQRVLHGEFTVQTKKGVKLLDTEIGVITAVTPTSVAVRASDGYTQTWVLGASTHVRANRQKATLADLTVGETVRLMGPASGGSATAELALVRPTA